MFDRWRTHTSIEWSENIRYVTIDCSNSCGACYKLKDKDETAAVSYRVVWHTINTPLCREIYWGEGEEEDYFCDSYSEDLVVVEGFGLNLSFSLILVISVFMVIWDW